MPSKRYSQTNGTVGIDNALDEINVGWLEKRLTERGVPYFVRDPEGDMSVFDAATLIIMNRPLGGGTIEDLEGLMDQYRDGAHILFAANYGSRQELREFNESELGREFTRLFKISDVYVNESNGDVRIPCKRTFRNYREARDEYIHEFIVRKGQFKQKLVNTDNLSLLKGIQAVETDEPSLFLHVGSIPENRVIYARLIDPNWDVEEYPVSLKFSKEEEYSDENIYSVGQFLGYYEGLGEATDKFLLKTSGFLTLQGCRAVLYHFGFDILREVNYGIILKLIEKSAESRPRVLRQYNKEKERYRDDESINL